MLDRYRIEVLWKRDERSGGNERTALGIVFCRSHRDTLAELIKHGPLRAEARRNRRQSFFAANAPSRASAVVGSLLHSSPPPCARRRLRSRLLTAADPSFYSSTGATAQSERSRGTELHPAWRGTTSKGPCFDGAARSLAAERFRRGAASDHVDQSLSCCDGNCSPLCAGGTSPRTGGRTIWR